MSRSVITDIGSASTINTFGNIDHGGCSTIVLVVATKIPGDIGNETYGWEGRLPLTMRQTHASTRGCSSTTWATAYRSPSIGEQAKRLTRRFLSRVLGVSIFIYTQAMWTPALAVRIDYHSRSPRGDQTPGASHCARQQREGDDWRLAALGSRHVSRLKRSLPSSSPSTSRRPLNQGISPSTRCDAGLNHS